MQIWADILAREGVMLLTLLALGSGLASYLGQRFDAAARVAIAPALGLCAGVCVFSTLIWFTAARNTFWLLPPLALVSLTIALRRGFLRGVRALDAAALVAVCVVVASPLSYTLHERDSVGPVGYYIWDADDYAVEPDAMEQQSIHQALSPYSLAVVKYIKDSGTSSFHPTPASLNFTRLFWTIYTSGNQNIDASPLSANLNRLIGLHGTDTQTLYLIAFLVAGALGAFAAIRYFSPKPLWAAPFAGVLFAGPFFLQLMDDGSQAAICGLSVLLPLAAVGTDALRKTRWASLVVLAVLVSGLMALYPLFLPGFAIAAVVVLATLGIRAIVRREVDRDGVLRAVGAVGLVVALCVVFDVVVFLRDARYWIEVLKGAFFATGSLPQYKLPFSVLPGWLLQTHEFYSLTHVGGPGVMQVLLSTVFPIVVVIAVLAGLIRVRLGVVLLLAVLVYAGMALYTSAAHGCSYCTDRALLPIAPLSIGLIALAVAALASASRVWIRPIGIALAVVVLVVVGVRAWRERILFAEGTYFLDSQSRTLLSDLPSRAGAVEVEGYSAGLGEAAGELPLVYYMASERNHGWVSVPTEYDDYGGLSYLGGVNPRNLQFDPGYRYVLTRFGGMETGRRVIARDGPVALEERVGSLDATLISGVDVPFVRLDKEGMGWMEGPLHMLVVGGGAGPVWVSLRFRALVAGRVPRQPGVEVAGLGSGVVDACVRATGKPPLRKATINLEFPRYEGTTPPGEPYAGREPNEGFQVAAMQAVDHCSLAST
jgi:hypothetical protein